MNRTRMTMALVSSLLVAQIATAQMMGGGSHRGSAPSTPGNPFGGMNGGGMIGDMGGGMGRSLTVGADGVVYTLRAPVTTTTETPSVDVVAIRPTGTTAWTTKIEGRMTRLELSGNLVLVATGAGDMGMNGWNENGGNDASRLIALSAASGSIQWQIDLDGFVSAIEPFSGGIYALTVQHDGINAGNGMRNGSNGPASMKRSVAAIDNAGKVLWSIDLN